MQRSLQAELLDHLPADDPRAIGSRRDLERVNASMGNAQTMARTLQAVFAGGHARRLVEIGAGDGRFALGVARKLGADWRGTNVALVDRANAVLADTRGAFGQLGWKAESVEADVFDWIKEPSAKTHDAIIANLFLHHFSNAQLAALFRETADCARVFVAVEPRRCRFCLGVSRLLWLIGCNQITRHDAPVSVRAGFAGRELSRLWPDTGGWILEERAAGFFSHLFVARRAG